MIVTTPTQDGISVAISTRATKLVQLELTHHYLENLGRVRMTAANARAIACDLLAAAKAVEAQNIVEIDAGAGGLTVSPQRDVCGREVCGRQFQGGMCTVPAGERCGFTWCSNTRHNGGYVNWSLLAVLSLAAGVWVGLGASVAHWCRYF